MAAKVPSNQIRPLDISVDKPARRRRSKAKRQNGEYLKLSEIDLIGGYDLIQGPTISQKKPVAGTDSGIQGSEANLAACDTASGKNLRSRISMTNRGLSNRASLYCSSY